MTVKTLDEKQRSLESTNAGKNHFKGAWTDSFILMESYLIGLILFLQKKEWQTEEKKIKKQAFLVILLIKKIDSLTSNQGRMHKIIYHKS